MDVITKTVDAAEKVLGHSPHTAIVAVPLGAFTVSNISDVMYLATGHNTYDDAASMSMAVGLAGASLAAVTGLRDYSSIPRDRQPSHQIATTHALGNAVVGTLFAASFAMRLRSRTAGGRAGTFPRLLALAGGALSAYTGWLGRQAGPGGGRGRPAGHGHAAVLRATAQDRGPVPVQPDDCGELQGLTTRLFPGVRLPTQRPGGAVSGRLRSGCSRLKPIGLRPIGPPRSHVR